MSPPTMAMPRAAAAPSPLPAEGQRERGQQRRHRGHHDRAEAQAGRPGRSRRRGLCPARALRVQGEVDHHDRVLLHDADQQDDADQRDDAQLLPADQQREDRPHARRRQRGQDGERVDVALVEHAQHDVDRHQRGRDEQRLIGQGRLECLRRPLEAPLDARGQPEPADRRLHRRDRIAEGRPGRQVERQRHRRELPLARDHKRGRSGIGADHGVERHRHRLPASRAGDVDVPEGPRALPELGLDLEHDPVLVELGEHRGDLPLAEGVVERVVDRLRADAEPRRGAAIHHQRGAEALVLLVAADIGQLPPLAQHVHQPRGP